MKIKYLLTLSFCAVATNYCGDRQVAPCNKTSQPASAVLAGFSGAARPATKYDVDWREAFKQGSTSLIDLFYQLKEAVQINDSKRASKIFKFMNAQLKPTRDYARYISFMVAYDKTVKKQQFYPKYESEIVTDSGHIIRDEIYSLGFDGRRSDWSLYGTRKEGVSEKIANILEHLYCISNVSEAELLKIRNKYNKSYGNSLLSYFEMIMWSEKCLNGETEFLIEDLECIMKHLTKEMPNVKNSHIKKRAEGVLNKMKQRLQELTKND